MNKKLLIIPLIVFLFSCHRSSLPPEIIDPKDGALMLLVPSSEFTMGTSLEEIRWFEANGLSAHSFEDESPQHRVYLDAFYIDHHEVTNTQYQMFVEATNRPVPSYWYYERTNGDEQPVVGVSWHDASAYCRWAGKRLPTEAEWEKAARGTDGRLYPWGSTFSIHLCNASTLSSQGMWRSESHAPTQACSYTDGKSPYGALNMAGNVSEWVADWYAPGYYQNTPTHHPLGPRQGQQRVVRGGSWQDTPMEVRCAARYAIVPENPDALPTGFRCVKSAW